MRTDVLVVVSTALLFLFGPVGPHHDACASASQSQGIVVEEFYASAPDGAEYFVIVCTGYQTLLDGWSVTDGEGTVTFAGGTVLVTGGRLAVSWDPASYASAYGRQPEVGLDGSLGAGLFTSSGTFRLADDGDSIAVLSPSGEPSDVVVYGDSALPQVGWAGDAIPPPRSGEVLKRIRGATGPVDTDAATDWFHFREHRYGHTSWAPVSATVPAGQLTAFVSPECSLECVLNEIGKARESIRMCAYELSSPEVCEALVSALGRGVSVSVLVDGSPAGGMSEDGMAFLSVLEASGADVKEFTTVQDGSVRHVLALHPKYMVVDCVRTVVMSENFVQAGLPGDTVSGNRGWGVAFTSSFLSSYVSCVFDDDSRRSRKDVLDWGSDPRNDPQAALPPSDHPARTVFFPLPLVSTEEARVGLQVSPDCSPTEPYLCGLIDASSSLLAEQFQADTDWESRWTGNASMSPVVSAIAEVILSGGTASVLLDSSWFNLERNSACASALRDAGVDARLLMDASPLSAVHNKGLVLDSMTTVVSSNNWVSSSYARNRELAAVVASAEVASYFSEVFSADWVPDSSPPMASAGADIFVGPGSTADLSASGSVDDRAIASYEWDVGGDGSVDGDGLSFEVVRTTPSRVTVVLRVTDSWGNTAEDAVLVTFGEPGADDPDGATDDGPMGDAMLVAALVAAPALMALRKTLITRLRDCLSACCGPGSSRPATSRVSSRSSRARSGRPTPPRCISQCTTSGLKASSSSRRRGGS